MIIYTIFYINAHYYVERAKLEDYSFYVQCSGQVESGNFGPLDNLYCRYSFHFGNDWTISGVSIRVCDEDELAFSYLVLFDFQSFMW